MHVIVAPPPAFVTGVHAVQVAVVADSVPAEQVGWPDR